MEEQVKKTRTNKAVSRGRERVKNVSVPVFDEPKTDWLIDGASDGVPVWWKHVAAPKVSKKERVRQMKNLKRTEKAQENRKLMLEQKNAEYREKLREDARLISEELSSKKAHVKAIIDEENRNAEIERLNTDLEIKRLEEERMLISAEEERLRLAEEEEKQLIILDKKRSERRERQRARKEEAELLKKEEAERAERERLAREERMRLIAEQNRARDELRAQQAEIKRKNYEEQLRRESEEQEKVRLIQLQKEQEELKKIEESRALLVLEAERARAEIERIDSERKAAEEREARLQLMRDRAEAKRIKRERKNFHVPDHEYQPYPKAYPDANEDCIVELYETCVRDAAGIEVLPATDLLVVNGKLNAKVVEEAGAADIICDVIARSLKKGQKVHSGQVRFRGKNVIELPINAQRKDVVQNVYFVGLESDLYGDNVSVERYCADLVGEADAPVLRDHLFRFNLIKKGFMKRKMSALTVSERARVMISCAMLTKKELVVLVDPQQWLDAPSRLTLKELLVEWKNSAPENTLLVLTSDEVILPKKRGKNG